MAHTRGRIRPSIAVAAADVDGAALVDPPVLIVEVLSPSTRRFDLGYKFETYAKNGASWYWVIDPEVPSLTIYRNEDGSFVEAQRVTSAAETAGPVTVHFDPGSVCR